MHGLISNVYLVLWVIALLFLIYRLIRLVSQQIIVKGEFSRILLYTFTIASLAAYMTPQLDEVAHYCMKLCLMAGVAGIIYMRVTKK